MGAFDTKHDTIIEAFILHIYMSGGNWRSIFICFQALGEQTER